MSLDFASLLLGAVGGLLLIAVWTDLTSYRIPNWISLAVLGLFPLFAYRIGLSLNDLLWHGLAFAVVLAAGLVLFVWNRLGAGDAKLLAAVALWVGWGDPLIRLVTLTTLIGGGLSLTILLCRWTHFGVLVGTFLRARGWDFAVFDASKNVAPYAVAIGGAFFVLLFVPL